MKRRSLVGAAWMAGMVACAGASAGITAGAGNTPFWISLGSPQQIDNQVARLLGDRSSVVVVRLPDEGPVSTGAPALLRTLKKAAPQTPVLMYTWASRSRAGKSGHVATMDWVDTAGGRMTLQLPNGRPVPGFGNVTDPDFRSRTALSISAALSRSGFDGIAVDLAIRTPRDKPAILARMCSSTPDFCTRYAAGVDATFDAIRKELGNRPILFNGLWNNGPDSVGDQMKLLDHADAAAVEYFGQDPRVPTHSFAHDVMPFLGAMAQARDQQKILVFGRGPWSYVDYAQDYAWQRYLYCAYLLGANANTYFKYNATFQAETPNGRTGGLAVFADWSAALGAPQKASTVAAGVHSRPFAHGLVLVAPDDGQGGSFALPKAMYSPEGDKYEGRVSLHAGEALLLLDTRQAVADDRNLLDLALMADWQGATVKGQGATAELGLQAGAPVGSHDMLLDPVRSMHPRNVLQLSVQADAPSAALRLVAEVDDPSHRHQYAVVDSSASSTAASGQTLSLGFRLATPVGEPMPVVPGPALTQGAWQSLKLDGHALFAKSGLVFRRWDYARFDGAMKIKSVALSN